MPTLAESLTIACNHHLAGRLEIAERMYREILALEPKQPDALHLLGALAGQTGRHALAVELLRAAIGVNEDQPTVHTNLGAAYFGMGNLSSALASYERALELSPDDVQATYGLGLAQLGLGRLDDAESSFQRALLLRPDFAEASAKWGDVLADKGQAAEAVARYERALQIRPDHAQTHYNLANCRLTLGHLPEAAASYRQALRYKPDYAQAHANLGLVLKSLGQLDEAVACLQRALRLDPNQAKAHNTLGLIWLLRQQLDPALACFQRAVGLEPDFAAAHNNLAAVLKDRGQLPEAIAALQRAVQLQPDYAWADSNVINTLQFCPGYDEKALSEERRRWNTQHAQPLAKLIQPHANDPSPQRRLRIGYISPDFRDHVVGHNMWPLLRHHDHERVEITLYSNCLRPDHLTVQFRKCADNWREIHTWPDEKVVEQIRQDRIDILVDLALHLMGNRLLVLARQPAPVQVTFAGYPGSTGMDAIDYRLTDPYLDPPGLYDAWSAEKSYRLPHTFWCYNPPTEEPRVGPLPALTRGFITFGCLNNFCKVNDDVLALWARVLIALPGSRLVLMARTGSHRQRTLDFLAGRGVAAERVDFFPFQPRQDYLAVYNQVDIGLDTFPYNGHSTSLDSFWMGVPVVTLVGQTIVGRAGLSQLTNLGLTELIAATPEEWFNLVVSLAHDLPRLAALRYGLRRRMRASPLMDAAGFAGGIEAAYRDMWQGWCAEGRFK